MLKIKIMNKIKKFLGLKAKPEKRLSPRESWELSGTVLILMIVAMSAIQMIAIFKDVILKHI